MRASSVQDYQCVEVSPDVVGDAAAQSPDAAEAPNVVTLLLPPLNLLPTLQNSSEEEGNTNTRQTQSCLTYHIMRHWAPHLAVVKNGISNCSTTLNQVHKLQCIPTKVASPTSILGDDMPDNENAAIVTQRENSALSGLPLDLSLVSRHCSTTVS